MGYFRMYQSSMFAITTRRSGHDAFRHTEILASGTVPIMQDLDLVSKHSMAHHNKSLLKAALQLPGVSIASGRLDANSFNVSAYLTLATDALMWTHHRLTTAALAEYFLQVLGL